MKRGYLVKASRNGEPLDLVLQTSNKGMAIKDGSKIIREFAAPHVEIMQKLGKSRSIFRVDQKPAWWVEVTDNDGTRWPMRCRSKGDAEAIERWAHKHEK